MLRKRLEELSAACLAHLCEYLELFASRHIIIFAEDEPQAGARSFSAIVNGCPYHLACRERTAGIVEVSILPGRYNPCRDSFSQEAIHEALAYLERERAAVRTVIVLEKAAPPCAAYRFGYRVTIDGEPVFVGCFDHESGPVFAPIVEVD